MEFCYTTASLRMAQLATETCHPMTVSMVQLDHLNYKIMVIWSNLEISGCVRLIHMTKLNSI